MTPEEKAKDLYDKFYGKNGVSENKSFSEIIAKRHALICVEEIIQDHKNNAYLEDWKPNLINYWQEVKQFLKQ